MATGKNKVLFLDRDGTINVDIGPEYVSHPEQMKLIPGAGRAIARAVRAGFKIAIITNQAGVAKGKTPPDALPRVHRALEQRIAAEAGLADFHFDDIRVCMHHPDDKCACRKPETRLLTDSVAALDADPARSFFVGDKDSDLICARRVGIRSVLVLTGHGKETEVKLVEQKGLMPAGIEPTLSEAVDLILSLTK